MTDEELTRLGVSWIETKCTRIGCDNPLRFYYSDKTGPPPSVLPAMFCARCKRDDAEFLAAVGRLRSPSDPT